MVLQFCRTDRGDRREYDYKATRRTQLNSNRNTKTDKQRIKRNERKLFAITCHRWFAKIVIQIICSTTSIRCDWWHRCAHHFIYVLLNEIFMMVFRRVACYACKTIYSISTHIDIWGNECVWKIVWIRMFRSATSGSCKSYSFSALFCWVVEMLMPFVVTPFQCSAWPRYVQRKTEIYK